MQRVAIVPTPGMGHLFPLIELAKRLVADHNFAVTFLVPNDGSSMELQKKLLTSLPHPISHSFLAPASLEDLSEDGAIETRIELTLTRSLGSLRESLAAMASEPSSRVAAMVVDVFGPCAFHVARELDILPFVFFPTTATVLSFFFHLTELDGSTRSEYRFLPDPIKLPGCVPVHGRDLFSPLHDRQSEAYRAFVEMSKKYRLAHGIMVNTFVDLEPGPIEALKSRVYYNNPPIYPIGPLTRMDVGPAQSECLTWLDGQPIGSVLFVSFGSGGSHSGKQLTQLALGLERSGQRFMWVLKSPNEKSSHANFFNVEDKSKSTVEYLPEGFLERTKDVGLVVELWAPQAQILAHKATGGFVTHCGWNSTLESLVNGVPLVAWPLYAEQRTNAVVLAEGLGVALRVEADDEGIVGHNEIADKARELMEGEIGKSMRKRMSELKECAHLALATDGLSTKSLDEVARIWKAHNN